MRTICRLDLAGVEMLLDWAAAEGWNPGLADVTAFHAADPDGFIGAFVGGVMVAGIAAVAYDAQFGFIGLYICHPDHRGLGHGKAVWDAAMAYLGGRTIGLDGVPEQQANYARMGFVPIYETVRMSGVLPEARRSADVVTVGNVQPLMALDRSAFPATRRRFLERWIASPSIALARSDGSGFAVSRPCRTGNKIGPLTATGIAAARQLLDALEGPVQIDVPLRQTAWLQHLEQRGFTSSFATARMYRGPIPQVEQTRIFGVTSLELG